MKLRETFVITFLFTLLNCDLILWVTYHAPIHPLQTKNYNGDSTAERVDPPNKSLTNQEKLVSDNVQIRNLHSFEYRLLFVDEQDPNMYQNHARRLNMATLPYGVAFSRAKLIKSENLQCDSIGAISVLEVLNQKLVSEDDKNLVLYCHFKLTVAKSLELDIVEKELEKYMALVPKGQMLRLI